MAANALLRAHMTAKINELMEVYEAYNRNLQSREAEFDELKTVFSEKLTEVAAKDQQIEKLTKDLNSTLHQLNQKTEELELKTQAFNEANEASKRELQRTRSQIQTLNRKLLDADQVLSLKEIELDFTKHELHEKDCMIAELEDLFLTRNSSSSTDGDQTSESESPPATPVQRARSGSDGMTLSPILEEDSLDK